MPTSPMNPLQVQLFTGAAAGRRARFARSPITFGRGPENAVVVEDSYVSRLHGEIRFEGGQWVLINLSANGTRVNRKLVTDKPQPLMSGDEVYVGDKLVFNLTLEPIEAANTSLVTADGAPLATPLPRRRAKSKLWVGISVYLGGLLLLVLFLSTMGKKQKAPEAGIQVIKADAIEQHIRKALSVNIASDAKYNEHLADADRLFRKREVKPSGRFEAYRQYQLAVSHSGRKDDRLKDEDALAQANFMAVRDELIDKVQKAFSDALNRLQRGDNEGAFLGFENVKTIFDDPGNEVYKNAQELQNVATKRLGGKKLKKN